MPHKMLRFCSKVQYTNPTLHPKNTLYLFNNSRHPSNSVTFFLFSIKVTEQEKREREKKVTLKILAAHACCGYEWDALFHLESLAMFRENQCSINCSTWRWWGNKWHIKTKFYPYECWFYYYNSNLVPWLLGDSLTFCLPL